MARFSAKRKIYNAFLFKFTLYKIHAAQNHFLIRGNLPRSFCGYAFCPSPERGIAIILEVTNYESHSVKMSPLWQSAAVEGRSKRLYHRHSPWQICAIQAVFHARPFCQAAQKIPWLLRCNLPMRKVWLSKQVSVTSLKLSSSV